MSNSDKNDKMGLEEIKNLFAVAFFFVPILLLVVEAFQVKENKNLTDFEKVLSLMKPDLIWTILPSIATQLLCEELYATPKFKKFFHISVAYVIVEMFLYAILSCVSFQDKSIVILCVVFISIIWLTSAWILRLIVGIENKKQNKIDKNNNSGSSSENCCYDGDDEIHEIEEK